MALWMHWLNVLAGWLDFLSSRVGLGEGLAIVVLTLLVRTFVLPISWSNAYRNCVRQKTLARLQPELRRLKEKFGDQPKIYAERLAALYRENGIQLADGRALLGALAQAPVLLGLYQMLRSLQLCRCIGPPQTAIRACKQPSCTVLWQDASDRGP